MRVIGLTGGIASGKSTVAEMFRVLGVPVVDADQLARAVVEPGTPALAEIREAFGDRVIDSQGRLDRAVLGEIVFADEEARARLNAITHPRIAEAGQTELRRLASTGAELALYEAALIVENNLQRGMHALIVVHVPESLQLQRLRERDGLDEIAARARLAAQFPLSKKLEVADYVIDNSKDLEHTRAQVMRIFEKISEGLP